MLIPLRPALLLAFAAACGAAPPPSPLSSSSPSASSSPRAMVVVPIEDATFLPVSARLPDGPRMAVLWGDPSAGPSAVLLEMKRGAGPLHVHTADYHLVVLEGTMKHWSADQSEQGVKPLGPGSYWFQSGGHAHGDSCLSDRCVMQIVWSGPRDGKLADAPRQ
jgi:quercetin dioxygenase-like cupin family protein